MAPLGTGMESLMLFGDSKTKSKDYEQIGKALEIGHGPMSSVFSTGK